MNRRMRTMVSALVVGAGLALGTSSSYGHEMQLDLDQIAHASDAVVIGTVRSIRVYESSPGGMINTEVTFANVEVVHTAARSQAIDTTYTMTFAGGVLPDGRGVSVCDQPHFNEGERWMLFTYNDGTRYVNPMIGGPQGMYRIVVDEETGTSYPLTAGGHAVAGIKDGQVIATPAVASIRHGIAQTREANVQSVQTSPRAMNGAIEARTRRAETEHLPLTLDEFRGEVVRLLALPAPSDSPVVDRDARPLASKWSRKAAPRTPQMGPEEPASSQTRGTLCACGYHDVYAVFEQVPQSFWSYPENSQGMWMWNQYVDIFRFVGADGSWGDNGDNEFGGFPSEQDLQDTWEGTWGTAIAKTFVRFDSVCGEFEQADIVFNPAYTFTTDLSASLESTPIHYQQVVMHELGHAWGYITNLGGCNEDYSYSTHSVMHAYYRSIVEDGYGVHVADANLIRQNYVPAGALGVLNDIGVESYYVDNNSYSTSKVDRDDESGALPVYHQGAPITINNVTVENMGWLETTDLRLRLFLSNNQIISNADYKMPGYFEWTTFGPESYWTGDLSATLPTNAPPGEYWIGAIVTADGDSYTQDPLNGNNKTFWTRKIILNPPPPSNDTCDNPIEVVTGLTPIDTSYAYTEGPGAHCAPDNQIHNDTWYRYYPPCDGRVTITVCDPSFDTVLAVYREDGSCPGAMESCNNDHFSCTNGGSRVLVSVDEDQPYLIRVGSTTEGAYGPVNLEINMIGTVPNDFCTNPMDVGVGAYEVDNRCASTDGNAESCAGGQLYNDVWYRIQAPCAGYLVASTCDDSDFDTRVVMYLAAGSCPLGLVYGCSDDFPDCGNGTSVASGPVSQGRFYMIRVGGKTDEERGEATLTLTCHPACADANGNGAVDFPDLDMILDNWQTETYPGLNGDVNYDGKVNFGDLDIVLAQWGMGC